MHSLEAFGAVQHPRMPGIIHSLRISNIIVMPESFRGYGLSYQISRDTADHS